MAEWIALPGRTRRNAPGNLTPDAYSEPVTVTVFFGFGLVWACCFLGSSGFFACAFGLDDSCTFGLGGPGFFSCTVGCSGQITG